MLLADRAEINKANAQHSTGPNTPEGKKRSSLNALRHGLTARAVVMPTEDPEAYERLLKALTAEYRPKGVTESLLVQTLAETSWRISRAACVEADLLSFSVAGSPSVADGPAAVSAAIESQAKTLSSLSMHTQRLTRQFEKTLNQLRELQKIRRSRENTDLDHLLEITEMYEEKGETYQPSEDGFVFSKSEINSAILRRNRERLSDDAAIYFFDKDE